MQDDPERPVLQTIREEFSRYVSEVIPHFRRRFTSLTTSLINTAIWSVYVGTTWAIGQLTISAFNLPSEDALTTWSGRGAAAIIGLVFLYDIVRGFTWDDY